MDRVTPFLWLWMLFFAVNAIWALAQAAVASTLGARPTLVDLGFGPRLLSTRLAGIVWSFRPIALASSVGFTEAAEDAQPKNRLQQLSLPMHAAVILLPWCFQVAIAMVCLGASEGLHQFVHGFTLPFELSLLPNRVERFLALLRDGELLRAWGLVSAKLAAINLLPLPMLAGGQVLLLPWRNAYPVWAGLLNLLSLMAVLPWAGYVAYLVLTTLF
ncbi:hypothetical protein HPC49_35425 [Pyxidicoccus fallax]|uniref:Uncharacterized protein n=1 Tax=Pyxidicoccus fallax TaxID=394095 RepID=A0A848LVW2_9BACT|nr:hypothetical protein [Pyxidicoccus fallax]NMO21936.1 hypothetical protein [Pyxidicoccus fallax]NPC83503.1 hypothetical protein [Pyxidicoccus fallax]